MKATKSLLVVPAIALVFALTIIACDNGTGGGGGRGPGSPTTGTDPTSATYTSYDSSGIEYKLVITKAVAAASNLVFGRAVYSPQPGDTYELTITPPGTKSTGTVESIEGSKINLKQKDNKEFSLTVSGSNIVSFESEDDKIPVDEDEDVEIPEALTPSPGGEQPAHTHVWGEWTVTTPATETTDGEETRVCSLDPTHKETRPIPATGAGGNGTPGLAYTLINNDTAYSVSAGTATTGAVIIPATWNGLPVTEIGDRAFNGTGITSITIPSSVTFIGNGAFGEVTNFTSITVAAGNANFSSEGGILYNKAKTELLLAPQGISGSVTIPSGVTSIRTAAFLICRSLTSVTIPSGVTSIGIYAFGLCTSLTSITIPSSVTSIGRGAFNRWTASQTINIQGKADWEATIDAGWDDGWGYDCSATINYNAP